MISSGQTMVGRAGRFAGPFVALALMLAACSAPKPEPEIASSAPQARYAERYPAELQALSSAFGEGQVTSKKTIDSMSGYPDELKKVKPEQALAIVERADEAGRSYAYVERVREVDGAYRFFTEEKDEITKKVAGAAQFVAKQKGCEVDVSGPAAHALKESVDKQLEKRLRERNEAHLLIERYRESLGKDNAAALEKQADAISYASYVVHIELVEQKVRINRLLAEIETVKKTTDDAIAAERAFQGEASRTPAEKKAAEERIEALNKSKALLDAAVTQAQNTAESMQERITELQKQYADGFAALRKKLGAKDAATDS
jgi:hypothetical protein